MQGITPMQISFWSFFSSLAAWEKQDKAFGAGEWQSSGRAGAWTCFLSLCRTPHSSLHLTFWATSQRHRVRIDYMEINTIQDGTWLVSKLRWIRAFCLFWRDSPSCQGMACGEPCWRSLQGAWGDHQLSWIKIKVFTLLHCNSCTEDEKINSTLVADN